MNKIRIVLWVIFFTSVCFTGFSQSALETNELGYIIFLPDSTNFENFTEAKDLLDQYAKNISEISSYNKQIHINGYTAIFDNDIDPIKLSTDRANIVLEELISRGISAERFDIIKGNGGTEKWGNNVVSEYRKLNRRVTINIDIIKEIPQVADIQNQLNVENSKLKRKPLFQDFDIPWWFILLLLIIIILILLVKNGIWIPSSGVNNTVSKWRNVPRENGIWKRDMRNNIAFFPDLNFKPNRFNYWIDNLKGEGRQRFTLKQLFNLSYDFVKNDKIIKKLPEYRNICKRYKRLMKGKDGIMHSKDGQIDLSRLSILSVKVDNLSSNRYGAGNNMDRAIDLMTKKLNMTKNEFTAWKDTDQIWDNSGKKLSLTLHERKDGTIDLIPHAIHGNINHDGGVSEAMRKENFDD